jgi:hypothetical protein
MPQAKKFDPLPDIETPCRLSRPTSLQMSMPAQRPDDLAGADRGILAARA